MTHFKRTVNEVIHGEFIVHRLKRFTGCKPDKFNQSFSGQKRSFMTTKDLLWKVRGMNFGS